MSYTGIAAFSDPAVLDEMKRRIGIQPSLPADNPSAPPPAGPIAAPPSSPPITPVKQRQAASEQELARLQNTGSGVDQFRHNHPILGTIAKIGDVALTSMFPSVSANLPGTGLHHQMLENEQVRNINQAEEQQRSEAQTAQENAAAQKDLLPPAPKEPKVIETSKGDFTMGEHGPEPLTYQGAQLNPKESPSKPVIHETDQGIFLVDPATGQATPLTYQGQPLKPKAPADKTPPHITKMLNGKPHIMERNEQTGQYDKDLGEAPPNYAQIMPEKLAQTTKSIVQPDGIAHDMGWDAQTQRYDIDMGVSGTGQQGSRLFASGVSKAAGEDLIADIQANKDKIGNLAAWVKQYGINTPIGDPELARLQAEIASFAALQPAQHGFRSQSAMEAFEKILGGLQKNPEATIQSIRGITSITSLSLPHENKPSAPPAPLKITRDAQGRIIGVE